MRVIILSLLINVCVYIVNNRQFSMRFLYYKEAQMTVIDTVIVCFHIYRGGNGTLR